MQQAKVLEQIGIITQPHEYVHMNVKNIINGMEIVVKQIVKKLVVELYQLMQYGIQVIYILKHGMEIVGNQIIQQIIIYFQVQKIVDTNVIPDIIQKI